MSSPNYAVWVLILQVAAYMGYLDFGLQTAVGRYIAFANGKNDQELRDGVFSAAFAALAVAALIGIGLILVVAFAVPNIFPSVPSSLLEAMRAAIIIVGVSVAIGLPASAWSGAFVGLQRYEIPAIAVGVGKLLSAVGLIAAAMAGRSLVMMAWIVAITNLLSYAIQVAVLRRVAPDIRFRSTLITASTVRELAGYCASLTVWSFSMLLITGLDLLLVGRFQFSAVTPYSVCATLITFLAGIQNGIFGVIMPHAAELQANQDSVALGNLLVKATRLGVLLLLLTGLPLIVFAAPIMRIWIGAQFVKQGSLILIVLVIANIVRLTAVPFASILIGTGQQRLVVVTPLMEGVTNLVFSVALGLKYGGIGVAWGTLVGAVAAILANICYNLPRTGYSIRCSPFRYFFEAMIEPALCAVPVCLAFSATFVFESVGAGIILPACLISLCACAVIILKTSAGDFRSALSAGSDGEKEYNPPIR
jgi:O-antigen/teichoic acid export membrane protein